MSPLLREYNPLKPYRIYNDQGLNISQLAKYQQMLIEFDESDLLNKERWIYINKVIRDRCWVCNSTKQASKFTKYSTV